MIELDGTQATDATFYTPGFWINGDYNTIRGLVINHFYQGIMVLGLLNLFEGNLISTDVSGAVAAPNVIGIEIFQAANNNRIGTADDTSVTNGGTCDARCNLILGNRV